MFVLKSLGRMILGNAGQTELLELPRGRFWRVEMDAASGAIKTRRE